MGLPVFNFDDFSYEDCQTFIESLCVRESEKQKLVYLSSPLYKGEGNWHSLFQSDHRIKYINPKRWFTNNSEKLVFMDKRLEPAIMLLPIYQSYLLALVWKYYMRSRK